jgi:hypothetical protein
MVRVYRSIRMGQHISEVSFRIKNVARASLNFVTKEFFKEILNKTQ